MDTANAVSYTHLQEEQSTPDTAAAHSVEHIGEGDEQQVRTAVGIDAEAEAGREDNQAGNNCYKGIQCHNPHCFTRQALFLADVAAEDSQCADAKAQRKEGLSHSGEDYLTDTVLQNSVEVRIEIIFKA